MNFRMLNTHRWGEGNKSIRITIVRVVGVDWRKYNKSLVKEVL